MGIEEKITINATARLNAKYDNVVKVLLRHPKLIAPILRAVVPEYRDCTVDEVVQYIISTSIESTPVDSASAAMEYMESEKNSLTDKLIRYDITFTAINPKLSNAEMTVRLHFDLEVQNNYHPNYPLVKRAVYYAARELDSQLGVLTSKTNYSDLEKCYSIWICNGNIPERLRGTVSRYSIKKEDIIGTCDEPQSDYDLLTVIIIRGAGNPEEEIFGYLSALFGSNVEGINQYVNINDDEELLEGVREMEGLGASIYNNGIMQGRMEGRKVGLMEGRKEGLMEGRKEGWMEGTIFTLSELISKKILGIPDAAKMAGMSEGDFLSALASFGKDGLPK